MNYERVNMVYCLTWENKSPLQLKVKTNVLHEPFPLKQLQGTFDFDQRNGVGRRIFLS